MTAEVKSTLVITGAYLYFLGHYEVPLKVAATSQKDIRSIIVGGRVVYGDPVTSKYAIWRKDSDKIVYDIKENTWFTITGVEREPHIPRHTAGLLYDNPYNLSVKEMMGFSPPDFGRFADDGEPFVCGAVRHTLYGYSVVSQCIDSVRITDWAETLVRGVRETGDVKEWVSDFNKIGFPYHAAPPNFTYEGGYAHSVSAKEITSCPVGGNKEGWREMCIYGYDSNGEFCYRWVCDYESPEDSELFWCLCGLPRHRVGKEQANAFASSLKRHPEWDGIGIPPILPPRISDPITKWVV